MKKSFAFTLITALALCASQVCQGQANKNVKEANKLAREGAEAAKNQDWDRLFINDVDTQTPANRSTKMPSLNMAKRLD